MKTTMRTPRSRTHTILQGFGGASLVAASISGALAQEEPRPSDDTDAIERVIVTGSRVRNIAAEASSPIVTLDADALALSGAPSPEGLLNRMPQVAPSANANTNRGDGIATVDLRSLRPSRTLVLVNGRRYVPASGAGIVDLNSIPTGLVERVEVVTGGASAVYGSDALAGVVNFILKDSFDGMGLRIQSGVSEQGDGDTVLGELTYGTGIAEGRGNVLFSASYYTREEIFAGNRDLYRVSINGGSATLPPGRIENLGLNPNPAANVFLGGTNTARDYVFTADDGIKGFVNALPTVTPGGDRYNFTEKEFLQMPQDRLALGALGNFQLTDTTETFLEAFYSENRVEGRMAESPLTNGRLSPTNPMLPQIARNMLAQRPDPTANASFVRVLTELGPRRQIRNTDTYQLNVGLRGQLWSDWNWETTYGYGRTEQENTIRGGGSQSRIDASLLGCPAGTVEVLGCRLMDLFGPNSLTPADADYIRIDSAKDAITFTRSNAIASITGPIFNLPAGEVQTALGVEYRKDRFAFLPDETKIRGDLAGFARAKPTAGEFDVTEVFGELVVPVLSDMPGAQEVSLEFGARMSDYSSVGDVTTYKGGFTWRPIEDLRFRALYQRAIRAPSVFELFQGGDLQFITFLDPCATVLATGASAPAPSPSVAAICQLQGIADPRTAGFTQVSRTIEVLFLGNDTLNEETSNTWTAGLVFTPRFAPNLDVSVDVFQIEIEDYINRAFGGITGTINACYASGVTTSAALNAHPACNLLFRTASGELRSNLPLANVQTLETSGLDLRVAYRLDLASLGAPSWGELTFIGNLTYMDTYETLNRDFVGLVSQDFGANPKTRTYADVIWSLPRLETRLSWQRIASMKEQLSRRPIDATDYFNLSGTLQVSETVEAYLGINNLLDQDAPIFPNQIQNSDVSTYDVVGRFFFFGANFKF
jgi:iron complex outermembrane recepter protein